MNRAKYCRGCGRPLDYGARFCEGCGTPVPQNEYTAENMGNIQQVDPNLAQPAPANIQVPTPKRKRSVGTTIVVVLVGLVLIALALRYPLLSTFGSTAAAQVTDIRQVTDSSSDRMDYTYRVSYAFVTKDGETTRSSFNMPNAYDISKVPREGSTIRVHYLGIMPHISVPADYNNSLLSSLLMSVIGIATIALGISGKVHLQSRRRFR